MFCAMALQCVIQILILNFWRRPNVQWWHNVSLRCQFWIFGNGKLCYNSTGMCHWSVNAGCFGNNQMSNGTICAVQMSILIFWQSCRGQVCHRLALCHAAEIFSLCFLLPCGWAPDQPWVRCLAAWLVCLPAVTLTKEIAKTHLHWGFVEITYHFCFACTCSLPVCQIAP
jgi:hypothetical protein